MQSLHPFLVVIRTERGNKNLFCVFRILTTGGFNLGFLLGSVADANALFAGFAKQWKDCQGQTVTLVRESVRGGYYTDAITDVRATGSVVAATVEFGHTTDKSTSPVARAVGVKANCLVEAEIAYYSDAVTSGRPSDVDTVAIDIAQAMMERVEELT